jgi:hypothetical protein
MRLTAFISLSSFCHSAPIRGQRYTKSIDQYYSVDEDTLKLLQTSLTSPKEFTSQNDCIIFNLLSLTTSATSTRESQILYRLAGPEFLTPQTSLASSTDCEHEIEFNRLALLSPESSSGGEFEFKDESNRIELSISELLKGLFGDVNIC